MTNSTIVRSVSRAVDILLVLSEGSRSLRDVAEQVNLSKGTAHRLLATLTHRGLVIQDAHSGSYAVGPGCFKFVDAVTRGIGGLGPLAHHTLERLQLETGETITLHVRVGSQRICVAELPSSEPLRYTAGVGFSAPIHAGSAGKLLLAYLPKDERTMLLIGTALTPLTEKTPTDVATLESEMTRIRECGYSESHGERVLGAGAVSCPIFGPDGKLIAALSVLGPDSRIIPSRVPELALVLQEGAAEIGRRLAAVGSDDGTED